MIKYLNTEEMVANYFTSRSADLRDAIVAQHASMVERIARRFSGSAEPVEDLTQEGFIGLLNALELYDPAKGVKFTTYATHLIVGQIKHHLRDRGKIIKEPAWLQELNQKVSKAAQELHQTLGRQPSAAEIAEELEMTEDAIIEVITTREVFKVASIDASSTEEDESDKGFDIEKIESSEPSAFQLPIEDKVVLESAMQQLKEIEQKVIQLFFYEGLNQTEIAHRQDISCNYVSHILRHSVQKLRKILTTEDLKEKQLQQRQTAKSKQEIAVVDEQTGTYSPAYLRVRLEEEIQRASQVDASVALVLIRLSGLERFRAFYGEMTLSEFLGKAADLLKNSIRKSDILARAGEWEFGLIMPHTGENVKYAKARMQKMLEEWCLSLFGNNNPVEVSIASVCYPDDGGSVKRLFHEVRERIEDSESLAAA